MVLWELGGKVKFVPHTLLFHTRKAIRALFRLWRDMLRVVAGDAEVAEFNGVSIINAYQCPVSGIGILEHVAADVRTEEAKLFSGHLFCSHPRLLHRSFYKEEGVVVCSIPPPR